MTQKIQIIIENYDPDEKIVEGTKVDAKQKAVRFREKGLKVEEFKKLIRKKFGDDVEIINKVRKNREVLYGEKIGPGGEAREARTSREDGVSTRDIIEIMKNKYSD